jgi:DNA-binding CsgD family transcriptional regulator
VSDLARTPVGVTITPNTASKGVIVMLQQGQVFKLGRDIDEKSRWAYRYRVGGRGSRRVQRGGFVCERDASEALERALERARRARGCGTALTLAELVAEYLAQHDGEPETIGKLSWLLRKAVKTFGTRRLPQLRSQEIAAWRMTIPPGHRFEATQALRQVLARAVVWGMIDANPAKQGVDNPQRRYTEKRPFDSWAELAAVAAKLGPRHGPMVMFAAATGLRPGEWIALERRDIDRDARVVYVRRAYRNGRLKCTKTEASVRAVPLQAIALAALEEVPADTSSARLFPSPRGGHLDLHNFRNRDWKPAQLAVGRYVHPALGARMVTAEAEARAAAEADPLSEREREVLRLLALGHTNQEIAKMLYISVRTAETHRAHIMQKLRISTRAELVRYALAQGLLEPDGAS